MTLRFRSIWTTIVLVTFCFAPAAPAQTTQPAELIHVLHLPGIGGERFIDHLLINGLRDAGIEGDLDIYDWTNGDAGMIALVSLQRNQQEAQKISDLLVARHRKNPEARIYLTAHSGGAGLLVWALEKLPEDIKVESVLLLAPALSPQYDLTKALAHVRGKIHVFSSEDDFILGAGTRNFGTIDRVKTDAAGRIGFEMPDGADAEQYKKLVAHPYDPTWVRLGNLGDHIGPMMRPFARTILAALLMNKNLAPSPGTPDEGGG